MHQFFNIFSVSRSCRNEQGHVFVFVCVCVCACVCALRTRAPDAACVGILPNVGSQSHSCCASLRFTLHLPQYQRGPAAAGTPACGAFSAGRRDQRGADHAPRTPGRCAGPAAGPAGPRPGPARAGLAVREREEKRRRGAAMAQTELGATKQRKSEKISALAQPGQGCKRRAATEKIRSNQAALH